MTRPQAGDAPRRDALDDAAVSRLRLALLRVARRIRQNDWTELTPSQQSVLVMLDRFGAMSLGDLAAREGVRPPSVTRTVQALEAAGMISRRGPSRGSRRVEIDLTDAGRLAAVEVHSKRDAWLSGRMGSLSDAEIDALRTATPILEQLLEDER